MLVPNHNNRNDRFRAKMNGHVATTTAQTEPPLSFEASGRKRRIAALIIGYLLLYGGVFYSIDPSGREGVASLCYPLAGLTVFGMLAFGWAGVALAIAGNASIPLFEAAWRGSSFSVGDFLSALILHAVAYTVAILPLRRFVGRPGFLVQPAQVGWFLAAAALGAVLATGGEMARLGWRGQIDPDHLRSVASTWASDFFGIVALAPVLLTGVLPWLQRWLMGESGPYPGEWLRLAEWNANIRRTLGCGAALGLPLLALGDLPAGLELSHRPFLLLLLLLPLAWASIDGGIRQASFAVFALSVGLSLWLRIEPAQRSFVAEYQPVVIAIAVMGLWLGSAMEARDRARVALQDHAAQLERELIAKMQDLRSANQELVTKENYLRALVGAAPVGIAQFDEHGRCRYLNAVGCALAACSEEAARGRYFLDFVYPDDRDYVEFVWQTNGTDQQVSSLEFRLQDSGAWVSARWIKVMQSVELPLAGSIVILADATEQRRKDERIWTQAHYDALTALPNRNLFWERLDQILRRAKRDNQQVALLWVDLDGFKAINDQLGHAAGDELLRQAAVRLNGRIRGSDTVARMGGDEFTVVLPDIADLDAAVRVAANLVARLAEPFALQGDVGRVSASIGLALYPPHAESAEALVKCADVAMYAAKRAGKNRVQVWQPTT